jgi:hypothetical protein
MERLDNNTVDAAYRDSSEIVNARYYEYIALLFTAILLIMLFFRFNVSGNSGVQSGGSANNTLKIIIMILFIIFYFNRKKIYNQIIM